MEYITTKNVIVVLNNHGKNKVLSRIQSFQSMLIHKSELDHQLLVPKLKTTLIAFNHQKEDDFTLSNICGKELCLFLKILSFRSFDRTQTH